MESVFLSKVNNIGKITMLKDSLDDEMISEINTALDKVEEDEKISCLVLTSEGENFCTSMETSESVKILLDRIKNFYLPVVGMIQRAATGTGFDLALAVDIRFVSDDAEFGWVNAGLKDEESLKEILGPRELGDDDLGSGKIDAIKAAELGIANRVIAKGELERTIMLTAIKIADNAPIAVREAKVCINMAFKVPIEEGNKAELEAYMKSTASEDIQEGIAAVFQKRKPQFKGK
ncbi:MAG: enoyl-CoA hydratase/isomerase family protein [Candidatus Hermodarchaeota archaeon]